MATHTFVVSDENNVNSLGMRVMTAGIDIKQYKRNPIVLWYHKRPQQWSDKNSDTDALPIGKAVKLWKEDGQLKADIEFDQEDEFAKKIEGKVARGFINMCSPGLEPLTISEDPKYLLDNQKRVTLVKSSLEEISIVDIGSNDNALRLYNDNLVRLSKGEIDTIIPFVNQHQNQKNKMNEFQQKVATMLGLDSNAAEENVIQALTGKITLAKNATDFEKKYNDLSKEVGDQKEAAIITLVDAHVDKKFTADKRETFITLGKTSGIDALKSVLDLMPNAIKPGNIIKPEAGATPGEEDKTLTFAKLKEKGMKELEKFKAEKPADYIMLYKAEYGVEPEMEK